MIKYAVAMAILLMPAMASAEVNHTLTWTAPTARADGTPLEPSEIASYALRYGDSPADIAGQSISESADSGYSIAVGAPGNYCYQVRSVDTGGLQSDWSEPACARVNAAPAQINISITVNVSNK